MHSTVLDPGYARVESHTYLGGASDFPFEYSVFCRGREGRRRKEPKEINEPPSLLM